jgi:hypothetical protein
VIWTGKKREEAKNIFWEQLHELVSDRYRFYPVMAVDKLTQEYLAAMATEEIGAIKTEPMQDNLIVRIAVSKLSSKLMEYRGSCGFFYEYDCNDIMELYDFCNNTHCQTIGILGDADKLRPLLTSGIRGVDRVVPIGHTMDFDLNWDGYNLAERLTRGIKTVCLEG